MLYFLQRKCIQRAVVLFLCFSFTIISCEEIVYNITHRSRAQRSLIPGATRVNRRSKRSQCNDSEFVRQQLCPEFGWHSLFTSCLYISTGPMKKTWAGARKYCQRKGGDLVVAPSKFIFRFVLASAARVHGKRIKHWIGLRSRETKHFQWVNGSDLNPDASSWIPPEPNRVGPACVTASFKGWRDESCSKRRWFICQRQPNLKKFDGDLEVEVNPSPSTTHIGGRVNITCRGMVRIAEKICAVIQPISESRDKGERLCHRPYDPKPTVHIPGAHIGKPELHFFARNGVCFRKTTQPFDVVVTRTYNGSIVRCCRPRTRDYLTGRYTPARCSNATEPFRATYISRKPILKIEPNDGSMKFRSGQEVAWTCEGRLGQGKSLTMALFTRCGSGNWSALVRMYSGKVQESGTLPGRLTGDTYFRTYHNEVNDLAGGNVLTVTLPLKITGDHHKAIFACFSYNGSEKINAGTLAVENDSLSDWSEITVLFRPRPARLDVYYEGRPPVIYGGQYLRALCHGYVGTNGQLTWLLTTSNGTVLWHDHSRMWSGESSPCLVCEGHVGPKSPDGSYLGPCITSTPKILVNASFHGATLRCTSFNETLDNHAEENVTLPFEVQYKPKKPKLRVSYQDRKRRGRMRKYLVAQCKADVGSETEGVMSWYLFVDDKPYRFFHIDLQERIIRLTSKRIKVETTKVTNESVTGPRITSTISVRLSGQLRNGLGHVACLSYSVEGTSNSFNRSDRLMSFAHINAADKSPLLSKEHSVIVRETLLFFVVIVALIGLILVCSVHIVKTGSPEDDDISITEEILRSFAMRSQPTSPPFCRSPGGYSTPRQRKTGENTPGSRRGQSKDVSQEDTGGQHGPGTNISSGSDPPKAEGDALYPLAASLSTRLKQTAERKWRLGAGTEADRSFLASSLFHFWESITRFFSAGNKPKVSTV